MSVRIRNIVVPVLAAALFCSAAASARAADELYEAQAIVTGQREPERLRAFPDCLEDVLVKVSGDPRLIGDPRLVPLKASAESFVAAFRDVCRRAERAYALHVGERRRARARAETLARGRGLQTRHVDRAPDREHA